MELTREQASVSLVFINKSIYEYMNFSDTLESLLSGERNYETETEWQSYYKELYTTVAEAVRYRYDRSPNIHFCSAISKACNTVCLAINDLIGYAKQLEQYYKDRALAARNGYITLQINEPDKYELTQTALKKLRKIKSKLKSDKSFDALNSCFDDLIDTAYCWGETSKLTEAIHVLAEDIKFEIDEELTLLNSTSYHLRNFLV